MATISGPRRLRFDRERFSGLDRARLQLQVGGWRWVVAGLRGQLLYGLFSLQGLVRSRSLTLFLGWLDVRRLRWGWRRPSSRLAPYEGRRYSQNGEDGILEAIFAVVGTTNRVLVEIGAVPERPDLVVLDIDGNDWWVLGALLQVVRPRVLVVEYNTTFPPGAWWVRGYERDGGWDGTFRHGASLEALAALMRANGLELVGCDSSGVNAFFVGAGEGRGGPVQPTVVGEAYVPPWFSPAPWGHPRSSIGEEEMAALSLEDLARVALDRPVRLGRRRCAAGQPVGIGVLVRNGSFGLLSSGPGAPVHLALRWREAAGSREPWDAELRHSLVRPVPPAGAETVVLWARAPATRGEHVLECTLVQEGVAWLESQAGGRGSVGVTFSVR